MISKNQIKLIRSLEQKKNRKREGLFVAEGPKVVDDLLQAGYHPKQLFSTTEYHNAERITEEELHKISFLQHPQKVLAVFEMLACELGLAVLLDSDLLLNTGRFVTRFLILHRRRKAHRRAFRNNRRLRLLPSRQGSREERHRPYQQSA